MKSAASAMASARNHGESASSAAKYQWQLSESLQSVALGEAVS